MHRHSTVLTFSTAPIYLRLKRRAVEVQGVGSSAALTFGELLAGGLFYLAHRHLAHGEAARLPALVPALVEYPLTPYLGEAEGLRLSRQVEPLAAADF
jgi:hypothetical protein